MSVFRKAVRLTLLCCLWLIPVVSHAQGTCPSGLPVSGNKCYFIAASGADTNNGTSESTPWKHAPGMINCANICASTTPAAGQGFIFRGGDVYHRSASTSSSTDTPMGGQWTWSWSGTSGSCSFPSTTSSCIYIGVDLTWFSGGSFARPQLNLDNPTWANSSNKDGSHTGWVTACTYNDAALVGWDLTGSNVIIDNWEFLGKCWSSLKTYGFDAEFAADTANGGSSGNGTVLENSYFHGWTMTYSGGQASPFDKAPMIGGAGSLWILTYSVFDGADAGPPCNASGNCSGDISDPSGTMGIQNWDHNVFRRIANTTNGTADVRSVHDNLFEYMYDSFDSTTHSDVFFTYGNNAPSGTNFTFYNNMLRNVSTGQTFAIDPPSAGQLHFFNNVMFNVGNSGNCMQLQNTDTNNTHTYLAHNTWVTPCTINMGYNNNLVFLRNLADFQNNHLIGFASLPYTLTGGGTNTFLTVTDDGNEIFQTVSNATSQGYTSSNNYQPTSTSGSTYQAGANLSSSCSSFSADSALCNGTTGGVTNTAGSGTIPTLYIASPPARGTTWDAGAYQFSGAPPVTSPICFACSLLYSMAVLP